MRPHPPNNNADGEGLLTRWHDVVHATSLTVRHHRRLITFGVFLAILPPVLFSLLPTLLGASSIPLRWTLPWLLLIPLTIGYSSFRYRFLRFEPVLNRVSAYYLLIIIGLGVYLLVGVLLSGVVFAFVLLFLLFPIFRLVQRLTIWAWYGDQSFYVGVMEHLSEALSLTLDKATLRYLLVEELASVMRLSDSALFLADMTDDGSAVLAYAGSVGFNDKGGVPEIIARTGPLISYLARLASPVAHPMLRHRVRHSKLPIEERRLLSIPGIALWLPLISSDVLQGLLLIGPRQQHELYSPHDERVLATLARQSAIAIHNVRLVEQLQLRQQELARSHQQLLLGREQERRRIARELHDETVQQLLAICFQIKGAQQHVPRVTQPHALVATEEAVVTLDLIQQEVLEVVSQVRNLIGELRPTGLEEMGLAAALEDYVDQLEQQQGQEMPTIELDMDGYGAELPEPVAICLFRIAQEALRNAIKHAGARRVCLSLRLYDHTAVLGVRDDGCGFQVPSRLSEMARENHFGLIGMAEQSTTSAANLSSIPSPQQGQRSPPESPQRKKATPMDHTIRVLLADDHPLIRTGIRTLITIESDIEVVGEASTGTEAMALCRDLRPDILLLDLQMPGPSAFETVAILTKDYCDTRIIVLTAYSSKAYVRGLMGAGVDGYLLKDEAPNTVVRAIRVVAQGGRWFSDRVLRTVGQHDPPLPQLTPREWEILRLMAQGADNPSIAVELHLVEQTVCNYVSRIYSKLGVQSRAAAIVWARERDLQRD